MGTFIQMMDLTLFTTEHVRALKIYDAKMNGQQKADTFLRAPRVLPDGASQPAASGSGASQPADEDVLILDISAGREFPWWLWLANGGKSSRVVHDGITSVQVRRDAGGVRYFRFRAGAVTTCIWFNDRGKMFVR